MVTPETRAAVQERFPSFAYLLDVPEVGDLLDRAINEGWPEGRFVSSLYATNWYRQRTESARQIETLRNLDPAEFQKRLAAGVAGVQDVQGRLGMHLTQPEWDMMSTFFTNEGRDPLDEGSKVFWLNFIREHPDRATPTGTIYAAAKTIDNMYRSQFFYAPNWEDMVKQGAEIALGYNTLENVQGQAADWFSSVTPHLAQRLKAGETYADIVNPYREMVAKELELGGIEGVDMVSNNQWRWLLGMPDPDKPDVTRLPTQQEVIEAARKDPRWKGTIGATALSTNLVDQITRKWGMTT